MNYAKKMVIRFAERQQEELLEFTIVVQNPEVLQQTFEKRVSSWLNTIKNTISTQSPTCFIREREREHAPKAPPSLPRTTPMRISATLTSLFAFSAVPSHSLQT